MAGDAGDSGDSAHRASTILTFPRIPSISVNSRARVYILFIDLLCKYSRSMLILNLLHYMVVMLVCSSPTIKPTTKVYGGVYSVDTGTSLTDRLSDLMTD